MLIGPLESQLLEATSIVVKEAHSTRNSRSSFWTSWFNLTKRKNMHTFDYTVFLCQSKKLRAELEV